MDCQTFAEKFLADCGLRKNLPGSNAWYREIRNNGWAGTPEECRKQFGKIPPGAFLFILEPSGGEPEKYKGDGIGNASHIGIFTGLTGKEMADRAARAGVSGAGAWNFGDGAIHSSASRGTFPDGNSYWVFTYEIGELIHDRNPGEMTLFDMFTATRNNLLFNGYVHNEIIKDVDPLDIDTDGFLYIVRPTNEEDMYDEDGDKVLWAYYQLVPYYQDPMKFGNDDNIVFWK